MALKGKIDELKHDALKPRRIFLVLSAIMAVGAALAYFYQDSLISADFGQSDTAFAFLVGILIILSMFFLLCFRMPGLGNRLLGFSGILSDPTKVKEATGFHYSGGFSSETGLETKSQNTRRKSARAMRKKTAAITRKMQNKEK